MCEVFSVYICITRLYKMAVLYSDNALSVCSMAAGRSWRW